MDRRGLSLLEILVVMIIIVMMMALAVGILRSASKNLSVPATITHIESLAQTARRQARMAKSPVWLQFESEPRRVSLLAPEVYGFWHFESVTGKTTPGAFNRDATFISRGKSTAISQVDGKVGRAVRLQADLRIDCGLVPFWDRRQGFVVQFWINRDAVWSEQTLFTIGKSIKIGLKDVRHSVRDCGRCGKKYPSRQRQCPLCGEKGGRSRSRQERSMVITARIGGIAMNTYDSIPPFRWQHVAVYLAAGEARIYVNRMLMAVKKGEIRWTQAEKLVFGARQNGYRGTVDELSVGLIVPREAYRLPREVVAEFQGKAKADKEGVFVIHFDREGRLEAGQHADPVLIKFTGPEDQSSWLRFELSGELGEPGPPPSPRKKKPQASQSTGG